jgi:indolepyruvate decarboxylase
VTVAQLFARIAAFLGPDVAVIADPGDAMFAAGDLVTYHAADFFAPAYYCSLGYAVPAAIGAQLANPQLRPLVLVGDGAFQMTGLELSTAARFGLNPIVVVLNNGCYVTERFILDGPFNDITPWNYHRLPDVLGSGRGFVVETVEHLDAALAAARAHTQGFCLLDVRLDPRDISPALRRLTERLAQQQGHTTVRPGH